MGKVQEKKNENSKNKITNKNTTDLIYFTKNDKHYNNTIY